MRNHTQKSISKVTSYLDLPGFFAFSFNKKNISENTTSMDPCCRPDLAGVTYWSLDHPKATLTCLTGYAKNISLPDHPYLSLFIKIGSTLKPNLHIFGEFSWTIWGLLFGSQAPLRYQRIPLPLNSIHTSTWHALIHWSLRIPGFLTWIHGWQESPLKSAHELSSKVDGTTFSVNVPTKSLVSHSLYPTNRHVYFNTLVLCFNN